MNVLITGGAGFIGTNLSSYLLKKRCKVTIFDNLSRKGTELNLKWLKKNYPSLVFIKGDIRNYSQIKRALKNIDVIYHLAAQVTVTTSVMDPREDFEINLVGTFNLLEAVRLLKNKPNIVYASTNKVYGDLEKEKIVETKTGYKFKEFRKGISENQPLDFHSPYGCSKGAADQYVRDYSRIYNIPTIVFRQSCIYGPHQFGIEDQGWLAWFIIAVLLGRKIKIYGNGKQTRDVLYVEDLVEAYDLAVKNIKKTKGEIYNIGGGTKNALSVLYEFKPILEQNLNKKIDYSFRYWRPGDQKIYVSDGRKAKKDFNWSATTDKKVGIAKLINWIVGNKELIRNVF